MLFGGKLNVGAVVLIEIIRPLPSPAIQPAGPKSTQPKFSRSQMKGGGKNQTR